MNVTPADADLIKQYAVDSATAIGSMVKVAQMVPPGRKRHNRDPDKRRDAYLEFQRQAWDALSWTVYFTTLADMTRKPLLFGGIHVRPTRLLDELAAARAANSSFLAASAAVRLVGNPEPRAAAEQMTAIVHELFDTMPTVGSKNERAVKARKFAQWQKQLGIAQKDFTLICRRDLGYARALRTHWWQLWRPRSEEEWPGGWPVPAAEAPEPPLGEDAGLAESIENTNSSSPQSASTS